MLNDHIEVDAQGRMTALIGPDATSLMRAATIQAGPNIYIKTQGRMVLTRGATITNLLTAATSVTGKPYSVRKKSDHTQAVEDLRVWMETMKAALPVVQEAGG